jgi:hypothetical protein
VPGAQEFSGLRQLEPSLPSSWYFDPAQHALELDRVWYRNWIYPRRTDSIAAPCCYRTFTLGTQPVLLLRARPVRCGRSTTPADTAAHCLPPRNSARIRAQQPEGGSSA